MLMVLLPKTILYGTAKVLYFSARSVKGFVSKRGDNSTLVAIRPSVKEMRRIPQVLFTGFGIWIRFEPKHSSFERMS